MVNGYSLIAEFHTASRARNIKQGKSRELSLIFSNLKENGWSSAETGKGAGAGCLANRCAGLGVETDDSRGGR